MLAPILENIDEPNLTDLRTAVGAQFGKGDEVEIDLEFTIEKSLEQSDIKLFVEKLAPCITVAVLNILDFVSQNYMLTTILGSAYMLNSVTIIPILILCLFEVPDFVETYGS